MWQHRSRSIGLCPSGSIEYESVEERCRACEEQGGVEPRCVPEQRPCPRVELLPTNSEAMSIMGMAIHEDLRPFAPMYTRLLLRRKRADARLAILNRVRYALCSEDVLQILRPDLTKKDGE